MGCSIPKPQELLNDAWKVHPVSVTYSEKSGNDVKAVVSFGVEGCIACVEGIKAVGAEAKSSLNPGIGSDVVAAPAGIPEVYPVLGAWIGFSFRDGMAGVECMGNTYFATSGQYAVMKPMWIKLGTMNGQVFLTAVQYVHHNTVHIYNGDAMSYKCDPEFCIATACAKIKSAFGVKPVEMEGQLQLCPALADPTPDQEQALIRSLSLFLVGLTLANLNRR